MAQNKRQFKDEITYLWIEEMCMHNSSFDIIEISIVF